jgi:UDP-glucose 4-epimerase
MDKTVLVTGGAGYIGAHTAWQLIENGYEPVLVDNFAKSDRTLLQGLEQLAGRPVTFFEGDCCDGHFLHRVLAQTAPAAVLHFAAYKSVGESVEKPLMYYRNNINSLLTLLDVMAARGVRNFVFSSSCTVYGQPDQIPVTESAPFKRAESPYGATKQMCERILEDAAGTGFRVVSLRYFNPIGAHPSGLLGELPLGTPNNLVPYITQTAIGKRPKLTVFGNDYNTPDGSNIRDFIHVVDLAQAHVAALAFLERHPAASLFEAFNLGTGRGVSVLEAIDAFTRATGVACPFEIGPRRPGDVEKTYADPRKANQHLGWKAQYTLEQALADAWNYEVRIQEFRS